MWQKGNPEATLALGTVCSYRSATSLMAKSCNSQRGNSKHFSPDFPFSYSKGTHILQRRLNTLFYLLLFWCWSSNIIGLKSGTCHFQEVGSKWDFSFQFWQHNILVTYDISDLLSKEAKKGIIFLFFFLNLEISYTASLS